MYLGESLNHGQGLIGLHVPSSKQQQQLYITPEIAQRVAKDLRLLVEGRDWNQLDVNPFSPKPGLVDLHSSLLRRRTVTTP